jgi:hypothetical protein
MKVENAIVSLIAGNKPSVKPWCLPQKRSMRHGLSVGSDQIMLLVAQMHIVALERLEDLDDRFHLSVRRPVFDNDLHIGEVNMFRSAAEPSSGGCDET